MIIKKNITFVLGGCRSGKSGHALKLAEQIPGANKIFIATCIPHDDEMKDRVARHQKERSSVWKTIEIPLLLSEAISKHDRNDLILVDCLTLWISNILLETDESEKIAGHVKNLTEALKNVKCPVILVSNEVGTGIVPENRLARLFRDAAGFANQQVAASSDRVIWMVAGIPVDIKR